LSEALTKRLHSILWQDIAYLDNPKNNTGALCTRLATEASSVQDTTEIRIGTTLHNLASLGNDITISFVSSRQLAILVLAFVLLVKIKRHLKALERFDDVNLINFN
jgi:hypothetical protein